MNKRLILLLLLFCFTLSVQAQFAYRMRADILTKTRLPDSTFQISKGIIHYDQNYRKIIFDFTFPQKERVVLFDTTMYRFSGDTLSEVSRNMLIPDQSFFHYILSGNISNYGFEQSNFTAINTERQKDMVVTTWLPPKTLQTMIAKVQVATRNKQLYSVTIFDAQGEVMNRQILKNYQLIDGIDIPYEILMAMYIDNSAMYQIITLDNVVLNEPGNDYKYEHNL